MEQASSPSSIWRHKAYISSPPLLPWLTTYDLYSPINDEATPMIIDAPEDQSYSSQSDTSPDQVSLPNQVNATDLPAEPKPTGYDESTQMPLQSEA